MPRFAERGSDEGEFVVADEDRAILAYRIAPADLAHYGLLVEKEEPFCVVRFNGAVFQTLGPPNNEELVQHVLYAKGLCPYGAYEVLGSEPGCGVMAKHCAAPFHLHFRRQ
ncbi:conserved hypothetical protein (plasmid) [Paraburkholderia phymatum STM815]|uniref:Uncharacterized protein n=1 Tax=Paraburkholderia phymatum (strain DSM 17167 / CIP 108236 / LMG 21445 / STM815) TaxID=391038 RepID=B2JXZ5_PARP8|nr:conserved hypothetical protein [Paraburkholderia phymatum STM815]